MPVKFNRSHFAQGNEPIFFTKHVNQGEIHSHDFYEYIYVTSGTCTIKIYTEEIILDKEEIIIINKGVAYSIIHSSTDFKYVSFGHTNKVFRTLVSMTTFKSQILKISEMLVLEDWDYGHVYCDTESIRQIFTDISLIEQNQSNYKNVLLHIKYMEYIICFLDDGKSKMNVKTSKSDLLNYIANNLNTASLKEFAALNHISVANASKKIKDTYMMNFLEIKHEIQMQESLQLLENPNISIEEILEHIGVVNKTHFYKLFKEAFGTTPKKYRDNYLKKADQIWKNRLD